MKNLKIISYNPSISRVSGGILNDRVDANYYASTHLELAQQIGSHFKLIKLGQVFDVTKLSGFEFTKYFTEKVLKHGVIPCVMSENVRENEININSCIYITKSVHHELSRSSLSAGEIVLSYTGHYRRAAVVPESIADLHLGPNVCKLTRKSAQSDPYFYTSFLNGSFGQRSLGREKTISAQPTVNMERIRSLEVPNVLPDVQTYIGDKVRQAERLRERSKKIESNFRSEIKKEFPEIFGEIQARGRHSWAELEDASLNPGAYQPERLRIRKYLKENGGKQIKYIANIETPVTSIYSKSDIYIGLDAISSASSILTPSTVGESEVEGSARILSEGVAISKLRPYLNKVTYIPSELAGALGSTELLCIQPKSPSISSWFLYGVLKLESTIRQLNPVSTGSTHPRVSREDILNLMVPWLEDSESWGVKLEKAQKGYFLSEQLTTAAKLLVESLIEGDLKESELKAAQEKLQQGDDSLNRGILSQLTRKGYNVSGEPPLFPDLDALYEVLKEAETSQEVE